MLGGLGGILVVDREHRKYQEGSTSREVLETEDGREETKFCENSREEGSLTAC